MQQHAALRTDFSDRRQILQRSNFVVAQHDGNQLSLIGDRVG